VLAQWANHPLVVAAATRSATTQCLLSRDAAPAQAELSLVSAAANRCCLPLLVSTLVTSQQQLSARIQTSLPGGPKHDSMHPPLGPLHVAPCR
jgi:hypothetical protein